MILLKIKVMLKSMFKPKQAEEKNEWAFSTILSNETSSDVQDINKHRILQTLIKNNNVHQKELSATKYDYEKYKALGVLGDETPIDELLEIYKQIEQKTKKGEQIENT